MIQLLLHAWGDYITQNDWMATNKTKNTTKGWLAVFIHATTYSLPFLLIGSEMAVFIIWITHLLIDKFRLAKYLLQLKNWCFTPSGFPEGTPPFLSVWLLIIVDNILHITVNFLSLTYIS
jgi:hypothetical protein